MINYKEFNELNRKEKLIFIDNSATKIDAIFPWTGNISIVTIYSLFDFFVEIVCIIETEKITEIIGFNNVNYLNKYPQYFDNIKREIYLRISV